MHFWLTLAAVNQSTTVENDISWVGIIRQIAADRRESRNPDARLLARVDKCLTNNRLRAAARVQLRSVEECGAANDTKFDLTPTSSTCLLRS